MMKGETDIPFAKEVAGMMPENQQGIFDAREKDKIFWAGVTHFESRYWSIDQLLSGLDVPNILELSSGYACRGLDIAAQKPVHYIDTDLPDVIALKQQFITSLMGNATTLKGKLELLPLNALDEAAFNETINRFAEGQLAIVNEGLLMYLNEAEKLRLCSTIHKALLKRGGYWITADIYI